MTSVVVLHALGDSDGGAPWSAALTRSGFTTLAPDLPGHGQAAPSVDGTYTNSLVLLTAVPSLPTDDSVPPPVIVGVGSSGWVAVVLALAGRATALALVDGLGGPWRNGADATAEGVDWGRRLLDDDYLLGPVPAGVPDPRLTHLFPPFSNQRVARQAVAALRVPLLVISTPADLLSSEERTALLAEAQVPLTNETTASALAAGVVPVLARWITSVFPPRDAVTSAVA